MLDRSEYWKSRYQAKKVEYARTHRLWREANLARSRAHDRLRYLRRKKELSEGEISQCAEIVRLYPKRRIVWS